MPPTTIVWPSGTFTVVRSAVMSLIGEVMTLPVVASVKIGTPRR